VGGEWAKGEQAGLLGVRLGLGCGEGMCPFSVGGWSGRPNEEEEGEGGGGEGCWPVEEQREREEPPSARA